MLIGFLAVLTAPLFVSTAASQCIDYGEYLHWLGAADLLGAEVDFHGLGVSETRAAVLVREFGGDMQWHFFVQVVDVSDPGIPRCGGRLETTARAEDLVVRDEYAYVAYLDLLDVVDLSNMDYPHTVGHGFIPDDANGVDLSGNHVYVAYGFGYPYTGGLSVVDVSNPSMPATIGDCPLPFIAYDVAISGDIAVVLASNTLLYTVDISDPANPQEMGSFAGLGGTYAVSAVGNHAFVAADAAGLQVVDFSDPYHPEFVAELPFADSALHLRADGGHAYVANNNAGLRIVDISDPANPVLESTIDYNRPIFSVGLWETRLFCANLYSLYCYDISSCAYPPLVGSEEGPSVPGHLAEAGNYLFAAGSLLQVYDIADPEHPQFVASEDLPGSTYAMALEGDRVYVATDNSGLQIVDISDPLDPAIVGSLPGNWVRAVDAEGSLACIMHGDVGDDFLTVDVSDPAQPQILGGLQLDGTADWVKIVGSIAYATSNGLYAIDISDPTQPQILDMLDFYTSESFTVSGSYAYVPAIDFSEPYPVYMLNIVDVSDPENLQSVGSAWTPPTADIRVAEPFAYLACAGVGLYVYDVGDPANPVIVGGAHTGDDVRSVHAHDPYVYAGGWIYQGGQDYFTLHVASIQCLPTGLPAMDGRPGPTRLASFPNPSSGESSLRFELDRRERVEVVVYSPDGRLVRELLSAILDPGRHELTWDGRDGNGRPVPAGIYFSKISTEEAVRTGRFVMLR